jgi:hypothetical protein
MDRPEMKRPAVYALKSEPVDDSYAERIYIGEAESVGKRLKQHLGDNDRDFKECIIFTSSDEMLNKSTIKYLESRLVALSKEGKNAEIENGVSPKLVAISEADRSDMEQFIEQIKLILPVAGFSFLISKVETEGGKPLAGTMFHLKSKSYHSTMIEVENGFVVTKGSEAAPAVQKSISDGWKKLRARIIKEKVLAPKGNKMAFRANYIFSSASAASSVVLGRQSAGPLEWITKDGMTYRAYESEKVKKAD